MSDYVKVFLFVVLVLLVALTPLAIIWALNTLFGLGIAYTFINWLAVVVLNITVLSRFN